MGTVNLSLSQPILRDDLSHFLRRAENGSDSFEILVKGARCANCIAKIEKGVGAIAGVISGPGRPRSRGVGLRSDGPVLFR